MPRIPIDVPDANDLLAWVIDNPRAVADAVRVLNLLAQLQIEVVTPDAARQLGGNKPTIQFSDLRASVPIPLKFPNAWATPTGSPSRATFNANASTTAGATYDQTAFQGVINRLTETRQILAALIADLQATGQAPTV